MCMFDGQVGVSCCVCVRACVGLLALVCCLPATCLYVVCVLVSCNEWVWLCVHLHTWANCWRTSMLMLCRLSTAGCRHSSHKATLPRDGKCRRGNWMNCMHVVCVEACVWVLLGAWTEGGWAPNSFGMRNGRTDSLSNEWLVAWLLCWSGELKKDGVLWLWKMRTVVKTQLIFVIFSTMSIDYMIKSAELPIGGSTVQFPIEVPFKIIETSKEEQISSTIKHYIASINYYIFYCKRWRCS